MKKITYLFLLLFASLSYGQTCEHVFEVEGDDDTPMVLTVNASDLSCAVGTINSVTITDAILDDYFSLIFFGESYCGEYYSFELDIDGVVSTVCADDIIGMEITDFTTFTITSVDLDEYSDTVYMGVLIEVNYTPTEVPECATITGPLTESENAYNGVISWEEVAGVAGYYVSVGTTPGGTDILDSFDVENELTYDIEGVLVGDTEYFVNVIPYNSIGNATGCTEYSFTAPIPPTGSTCEDPLVVGPLPYSTTGDTSDYFDTIYEGVPGASCGATNGYLGGNDVVYAYTATSTGTITIKMTPTDTYSGIFVYGSCEDIGENCLAGAANSGTAVREIPEFEVTSGETYYIVISTWASPQTSAYTLDITEDTCLNPTAAYTIVSDCENSAGFLVEVEVTDLGSATSLTIGDNQNSATQAASAVGTFSFGPYSNGTSVVITINNDQDENCFLTSSALLQAVCPPNCENAEVIAGCGEAIVATLVAGPGAWAGTNACGYTTPGTELMYSFTPIETGDYELTVVSATTTGYIDYLYKEASGSCDSTGWTCIDDISGTTTVEIGTLTAGVEYLFLLESEGTTARAQTFKIDCLPTCTNATAEYTIVSDCENGEQFFIEVDVTSLGTATSLTVSDDQDSVVQNSTAPTVLSFGPYLNGTEVIITIANDQDETCVLMSPELIQEACPPSNDECSAATQLTVGAVFADNAIETTSLGATRNSADHNPTTVDSTCDTYNFLTNGKDVWYKAIVPASGTLTIETASNDDEDFEDTALYIYTGTCSALTYVKCSADISSAQENYFSKTVLSGLTAGEEVFARVWGYDGSAGSFKISAYDASLSNIQFENNSFKVHPNPVKDMLNLSYTQNITNVTVFNILGQQVLTKSVNAAQGQVDMSNLSSGTYLVKVASDNEIKSIKVIKE